MVRVSPGIYAFVWIFVSCCENFAESSHFQGASVSWRPGKIYQDEGIYEILIDFRIAWRRSTEEDNTLNSFCDKSDVESGKLLEHGNNWVCQYGCAGQVAAADVTCTEYDEQDNWSAGSRTAAFNITYPGLFSIEFSGCCWISTLVYATNDTTEWSISIKGNVGLRSDTGRPNSSPVSLATPVIRFQAGCPDFVDLLMYDADGDTVSCKFAECGQATCTLYPYLKLTKYGEMCRLSYNAGGPGETNVAISIVLEDFPKRDDLTVNGTLQNTTDSLSSVPVQFIVKFYSNIQMCSSRPVWVDPTFPNGFIKTAAVGSEVSFEVHSSSAESLNEFKVTGPLGITKYIDEDADGDDVYENRLTFTPTEEQIGSHMICVTVTDTIGKASEQRCVVLIVGEGSPCDVDNGGCQDGCEQSGESYYCVCDRKCWRLADDRRTCIPNIDIECKPDRFSFALPVCAVSASTVSIGYYYETDDPPCEAVLSGESFVTEVKFNECLTQEESDFTEIHYMNHVRMWVDDAATFPTGSGDDKITITRGYYYNMQLVCSFSKYANVNATFRPQDRDEGLVRVPGLGSFQFFFDFYVDDQFGAAYSPYEYPITVTVNSDIYFGIRTVGGTGLEVFTEKCVAMTTPTPTENTVSYTMIENGCFNDGTLERYTAPSNMEDRFSIKAFRFQDNLNVDGESNIYIQCSAVLCVVGDPTTRCQRGCIHTRKRRNGEEEIFVDSLDRHKRAVEESATEPPTNPPNISESNLLEITVSGPFRIEVEGVEGTPLVTVVTPEKASPPETTEASATTSIERNEEEIEVEKESDSLTVVVIASSAGAVVVVLLLVVLIGLICYYNIVLNPKHKVLPEKEGGTGRSMSAWTLDRNEENDTQQRPDGSETPPPSFWDIHPLTT